MQIQPSKPPFIHLASYLGNTDDPGSHYDSVQALAMYSPFAIFRALRIESGSLLESSREKTSYFLSCPHLKTASEVFHVMVGVQSIFVSSGYILLLFLRPGNGAGLPAITPGSFASCSSHCLAWRVQYQLGCLFFVRVCCICKRHYGVSAFAVAYIIWRSMASESKAGFIIIRRESRWGA